MKEWLNSYLNFLDCIYIGIVVFFTLLGIIKGFISQLFSLFSFFVALGISLTFSNNLTERIHTFISPYGLAWVVSFMLLLIGSMILLRVLNLFLDKFLEKIKIKKYDRILGGILGVIKALVICEIITLCIILIHSPGINQKASISKIYPYFRKGLTLGSKFLPMERVKIFTKNIRKELKRI